MCKDDAQSGMVPRPPHALGDDKPRLIELWKAVRRAALPDGLPEVGKEEGRKLADMSEPFFSREADLFAYNPEAFLELVFVAANFPETYARALELLHRTCRSDPGFRPVAELLSTLSKSYHEGAIMGLTDEDKDAAVDLP